MKKRILALTMAIVMIVGLLPLSVFAASGFETDDLPICNHEHTTTTTVDATCQAAGSETVICDDCNEVISTTVIEQLNHEPGTCENCAIMLTQVLTPDEVKEIPAGATTYYTHMVKGVTLYLTITGASTVVCDGEELEVNEETGSVTIELSQKADWSAYALTVTVDEGVEASMVMSETDPDAPAPSETPALNLGMNIIEVEDGYNGDAYTFTASEDGTYVFQAVEISEESGITDTPYLTIEYATSSETPDLPYEVELVAGDTLNLLIATNGMSAATVGLDIYKKNTDEYVTLYVGDNEVPMEAGVNYYLSFDLGMSNAADASWTYSEGVSLNVNGEDVDSYDIATYAKGTVIIATVAESATVNFNITITEPTLPELILGENAYNVPAYGSVEVTFTAEEAGSYILSAAEGEVNADVYDLANGSEWIELPHTFEMEAGDSISLAIYALEWSVADEINLVLSKAAVEPAQETLTLTVGDNAVSLATNTIYTLKFDLGEDVYSTEGYSLSWAGDVSVTQDGAALTSPHDLSSWNPRGAMIVATVEAETAVTFTVTPPAAEEIPEMILGENAIVLEAGEEAVREFTAVEAGTYLLSAAVDEKNAFVVIETSDGSETPDLPYEFTLAADETVKFFIYADDYAADTIDLVLAKTNQNLAINLSALSAESYIGAQFRIYAPAARKYDSVYLRVIDNGNVIDLTDNLEAVNNMFVYMYTMCADEMTKEIQLTPYGVLDGVHTPGKTITWSIRERIIEMLDANDITGNTDDQKALCSVLICMLKYGAEAQTALYGITDETMLATFGAEKHLSLLPDTDPVIVDHSSVTSDGFKDSYLNLSALDLQSKIAMQLQYVFPDQYKEKYEAHVVYNGETYVIDGNDFLDGQGPRRKVIFLDMIAATDLRVDIQITIYEKDTGTRLSETLTTTVESVATTMIGTSYEAVVKAMMNYGDAARAYLFGDV